MLKVDVDVLVRIFVAVLCALSWIVRLGTDEGALGGVTILENVVEEANRREILDNEVGALEVLYVLN